MIWPACSMPDADPGYTLPTSPSTIAETGDALSVTGVDTAVVVASAAEAPPPAAPVRARVVTDDQCAPSERVGGMPFAEKICQALRCIVICCG